ncbi:tetratricopeptide repeat protein [Deinococcus sp. SDU3-2]|uniref:Tetratricopeptide repeat protein n=1 Tax=Deinococcus terrestris TaxID=2651870 RepID=A0A7X1NVY6_9DEIO|nr:tetratricopeptide repeat protein [Deinococcus terrestris]MPY66441.1 tetratricopeptide repeat protein [Deinococcus terrestris]
MPLPPCLLQRLSSLPTRIVAPVEVGAGQEELTEWAQGHNLPVWRDPPPPGEARWLWWPRSRRELAVWSEQADSLETTPLALSGAELRLTQKEWRDALGGDPTWADHTFELAQGWPAALEVARGLAGHLPEEEWEEWFRHPLADVRLPPLLPPTELREAARALALTPLVTPEVAARLGVASSQLEALADGGWVWPAAGGWSLPGVLRRWLCPLPDPALAREVAGLLHRAGRTPQALTLLREAGAWDDLLTLQARELRVGAGPDALRAALRGLPPFWREQPAALYLAGLLARACGDPTRAEELYSRALPDLPPALRPLALNARGVVRAMRGESAGALEDLGGAARAGGLTGGEAAHNRATLLVQLGRHAEAERDLGDAVAAFREAGDLGREARSLEALGTLHFGRGLLTEALGPYGQALALLEDHRPEASALTHVNLAEVHALLDDPGQARSHLTRARALSTDPDLRGWVARVQALLALQGGHPRTARTLLEQTPTEDPSLRAETALLLARTCRELGDPDAAHAALEEARPLGLRADLEAALQGERDLSAVVEEARREDARLELATALLHRGTPEDLTEALALIRTHGYRPLLRGGTAHRLVAHAGDEVTRALFPLEVRVLGPLRVTQAGRVWESGDFPTRKSAALLVALALSGRSQPREALAERFWPGAKNPVASLQTAIYHLRSTFGVSLISSARGRLTLTFPVRSDLADLYAAVTDRDPDRLGALIRQEAVPPTVLPDLAAELHEERELAERLVLDALQVYAVAQPGDSVERRDALRALIGADPLDVGARGQLIDWHLARGEHESASQERVRLEEVQRELE